MPSGLELTARDQGSPALPAEPARCPCETGFYTHLTGSNYEAGPMLLQRNGAMGTLLTQLAGVDVATTLQGIA